MKESIKAGFPSTIKFPEELVNLCDWHDQNGYPISGDFELRADDGESIYWWFRSHSADDRLAQFGAGPDGSMYCIWLQVNGQQPIVHLGSEGDELKILASSMLEFIILLAIGYDEIGFDDLSNPPDSSGVNPKFQKWVSTLFHKNIPQTGQDIFRKANQDCEDFQAFIASIH